MSLSLVDTNKKDPKPIFITFIVKKTELFQAPSILAEDALEVNHFITPHLFIQ